MNCQYNDCSKKASKDSRLKSGYKRYCRFHGNAGTTHNFLLNIYSSMKRRVTTGGNTRCPHLYLGKPIMPKDAFLSWSSNHHVFLSLYKQWVTSGFNNKLTPTVDRVNSSRGYTLDNVQWITRSQNSALAGSVKKMKAKKEIYNLLGVNADV